MACQKIIQELMNFYKSAYKDIDFDG